MKRITTIDEERLSRGIVTADILNSVLLGALFRAGLNLDSSPAQIQPKHILQPSGNRLKEEHDTAWRKIVKDIVDVIVPEYTASSYKETISFYDLRCGCVYQRRIQANTGEEIYEIFPEEPINFLSDDIASVELVRKVHRLIVSERYTLLFKEKEVAYEADR